MSDDYADFYEIGYEERPRDVKVDEVKQVLLKEIFLKEPQRVFYTTQLETRFEREFFHWITGKGLKELRQEGKICGEVTLGGPNIYWSVRNRYWRRGAKKLRALLRRLYHHDLLKALGQHCEMMFDSALARSGFQPQGKTSNRTRIGLDQNWSQS